MKVSLKNKFDFYLENKKTNVLAIVNVINISIITKVKVGFSACLLNNFVILYMIVCALK